VRLRRWVIATVAAVAVTVAVAVLSIPVRHDTTHNRPQANEHPRSVP
jgi:hypothetical protein